MNASEMRDKIADKLCDLDIVTLIELTETVTADNKPSHSCIIHLSDGTRLGVTVETLDGPAEPAHTECIYCGQEIDVTEDEYVVFGRHDYDDREGEPEQFHTCAHEACEREAHPEQYDEEGRK